MSEVAASGRRTTWVPTLTRERTHALVVCLAMCAHLFHQWVFRDWYLEDAAIVFAYARNLVEGHGLVPWPGGERLEGYSDPLWLALIAAFHAVGVEGWTSGKVLAACFGAGALPIAWLVAKEALADAEDDTAALFAPIVLAANAPHAIWSASALENSLFTFLLLLGVLRVVRDVRSGGFPWSAVVFLGVALTRPDGLLYAAVGGAWFLLATLREGRGLLPSLVWIATFWVPYGAFVAARIWYFAFPLPMTYYAKIGEYQGFMSMWYARGWMQIREWCADSWTGWFLPVYVLGLLGIRGWRHRVAWSVIVVLGLALLVPGPSALRDQWFWPALHEDRPWLVTRIVALTVVALGLPFVAVGGRGWLARSLTWSLLCVSAFFSVYSNGDWTRGLRWMSFFSGTSAVLFAVGADELLTLTKGLWSRSGARWTTGSILAATLLVGVQVPPNLTFSRNYRQRPDDFPAMIRNRVDYTSGFAERVFLEERPRALDMDMGAHLWADRHDMIDMAGLVDIPIAIHTYRQRDFVQQYCFDESKAHFVYNWNLWAAESGFKSFPDWDDTFFRMPGFNDGQWQHPGIYARKDMILSPGWDGTRGRAVAFERGVVLEGWDLNAPEVGPGRALYLEVGVRSLLERMPNDSFTMTAFLAKADGKRVISWDIPMGYGVLPAHAWFPEQVFVGRFGLPVDKDLPPGTYDLGFFVTGARGIALAAGGEGGELAVADGAIVGGRTEPARFGVGEVRFPGAVRVLPKAEVDAIAAQELKAVPELAKQDDCAGAEATWKQAWRRLPLDRRWKAERLPTVAGPLARCWARKAKVEPEAAVAHLDRALFWDRESELAHSVAAPIADRLYAEGRAAMAAEDWALGYRKFTDVLRIAPHRSWARRYAEQCRDHELGIYDEAGWTWSRLGPW